MSNRLKAPSEAELEHQLKQQKIKAGALGRLIGTGEAHKATSTVFIIILLMVAGVVIQLINGNDDHWKFIWPIIAAGVGYIWGQSEK